MWRAGGAKTGKQESETFDDENQAEIFQRLVKAAGENWPVGWVRGEGFVEPDSDAPIAPEDRPFVDWATRVIDRRNGIESRTRADYHREVRRHMDGVLVHTDPRTGNIEPATVRNIQPDDIADWVRAEEKGIPDPDRPGKWLRRPASPKSIASRHSLLSGIFQAAVEAKPVAMRPDNPCHGTTLPRQDHSTEEEMVFLERDEWQRVRTEIAGICGGDALDLADILIGTGLRWSEATALQARDVVLSSSRLNIQRAWKRQPDNTEKVGPPKTKRARRMIVLSPDLMAIVRRLMAGKAPKDFLLTCSEGKVWAHGKFYIRRWAPAVKRAQEKGLTKQPRIHDLRHTHVSWLIAAKIPLPAIQARLGHESITTTVDRYGHLVQELDAEIAAAMQAALAVEDTPGLRLVADR